MKEILMNALIEIGLAVAIALGGAAIALVKTKISEITATSDKQLTNKVLYEVGEAVEATVQAINQTFVNELKEKNLFDKDAQEEAFERALEGTISALSTETVEFINNTYGDIENWLTNKIEAAVLRNKK